MRTRRAVPAAALVTLATALGLTLTACTGEGAPADPAPSAGSTAPTTSAGPTASAAPTSPDPTTPGPTTPGPTVSEPTTTNTLPPPPAPSAPAPSTAGRLTAASLPVPAGWQTVAREGGPEAGFEGNGTWVHAKDPRYAAQDLITIGCAPVTRDDYPDPTAALEGAYTKGSAPGIGLVLQFADASEAGAFYDRYLAQVEACTDPDLVAAEIVPSTRGLVDRRTYPDGEWTEVGARRGDRLTFVILSDAGHRISIAAAEKILTQIR